jgi:hypothetical protein
MGFNEIHLETLSKDISEGRNKATGFVSGRFGKTVPGMT